MKKNRRMTLLLVALFCAVAVMAQNDGNSMTYGGHTYTVNGKIKTNALVRSPLKKATATVTFTHVPSDYQEFEAVYKGLLGRSIQGTAAMIPMAIEMYARDAEVGEQCFQLICNSSATVSGIIRILKTKLPTNGDYSDGYTQRYMAAALLKGATSKNAYTPSYPYTVEMCASVNKPQQVTGGTDTFIYILAKGWDTEQRQVEIFKPDGNGLYKVYNCPSCYTQCKNIVGTWRGLK